jgi:hypothetical protein
MYLVETGILVWSSERHRRTVPLWLQSTDGSTRLQRELEIGTTARPLSDDPGAGPDAAVIKDLNRVRPALSVLR